jgi:CRISPR-associated protein Cas1
MSVRLFVKVTRELLPQVKDKFPFLYLEHGRLEVDDSSVKWISAENIVLAIPVATINCLMLGPGTSITQEAVKVIASANCGLAWVGEDSLHFFAGGITPTANTRNLLTQVKLATDPKLALEVVRKMYSRRFPDVSLEEKTLKEMMGMEGVRVKSLYRAMSVKYGVHWDGRNYIPGRFEHGDLVNRLLTSLNSKLYAIVGSVIHAMGYSMRIGFIHSGCPLPFVYDMADLYKSQVCIDLAFSLASQTNAFDHSQVNDEFCRRVLDFDLMGKIVSDLQEILGVTP